MGVADALRHHLGALAFGAHDQVDAAQGRHAGGELPGVERPTRAPVCRGGCYL
jgi:hypothetical protein